MEGYSSSVHPVGKAMSTRKSAKTLAQAQQPVPANCENMVAYPAGGATTETPKTFVTKPNPCTHVVFDQKAYVDKLVELQEGMHAIHLLLAQREQQAEEQFAREHMEAAERSYTVDERTGMPSYMNPIDPKAEYAAIRIQYETYRDDIANFFAWQAVLDHENRTENAFKMFRRATLWASIVIPWTIMCVYFATTSAHPLFVIFGTIMLAVTVLVGVVLDVGEWLRRNQKQKRGNVVELYRTIRHQIHELSAADAKGAVNVKPASEYSKHLTEIRSGWTF